MNCIRYVGFYGESIPYDSGMLSVIKGHGHYSPSGFNTRSKESSEPRDTHKQMHNTQGNGILLMRNPYSAIFGYRNYVSGGHKKIADVSKFFGGGK